MQLNAGVGLGVGENDVEVKRLLDTTAVRTTDVGMMLGVIDVRTNEGGGSARSVEVMGGCTYRLYTIRSSMQIVGLLEVVHNLPWTTPATWAAQ